MRRSVLASGHSRQRCTEEVDRCPRAVSEEIFGVDSACRCLIVGRFALAVQQYISSSCYDLLCRHLPWTRPCLGWNQASFARAQDAAYRLAMKQCSSLMDVSTIRYCTSFRAGKVVLQEQLAGNITCMPLSL